ncbi:MAG: PhnD/SsuA/transferrin family substrate-binding protein [Candidatus Sericytochromatia bacterium]|nr:PhnD/SsuA/transferrin family substrate-binding protein [Candidatus Sericytochromatia bacterium]
MTQPYVLGAVAYDPKVVTIWEGFKAFFGRQGLPFDYVLYSNYEAQVEAHLAGHLDVAWNSPLAWVRTRRAGLAAGREARAIAMRDTDRDLTSVWMVRADSPVQAVADLRGRTLGVGAIDSPQATLLPLSHLRAAGLDPLRDAQVRRFDVLAGKHGDHIGGERDAVRALLAGEVDAAAIIDGNMLAFSREGLLTPGATRVVSQTLPYDHCCFTSFAPADDARERRFVELLLGLRYEDPEVRPLLDLEGLKAWLPGRTAGYDALERAVTEAAFYDASGAIREPAYVY